LWIYNSLYRCSTCRLLNYSIFAKPWILLYYFAVVCLLIDETPPSPRPRFSLSLCVCPPVSQPTGVSAHQLLMFDKKNSVPLVPLSLLLGYIFLSTPKCRFIYWIKCDSYNNKFSIHFNNNQIKPFTRVEPRVMRSEGYCLTNVVIEDLYEECSNFQIDYYKRMQPQSYTLHASPSLCWLYVLYWILLLGFISICSQFVPRRQRIVIDFSSLDQLNGESPQWHRTTSS